jgi:hypothetical protein
LLLLLSLIALLLVRVSSKHQTATNVAHHFFHGHLVDDRLDQPPSGPASKSMNFPLSPRSSPNRCPLLRADRKPPRAAVAAVKHLHMYRHLWPRNRPTDATATTACARTFLRATSQSPPPPNDALHTVPLRRPTHHHGARYTVSFSPLHRPKLDPRAIGLHLGHFPHPLSPSVTGIGRHHRRSCASYQGSPASPISLRGWQPRTGWAGQKWPKCTVILRNFQLI